MPATLMARDSGSGSANETDAAAWITSVVSSASAADGMRG